MNVWAKSKICACELNIVGIALALATTLFASPNIVNAENDHDQRGHWEYQSIAPIGEKAVLIDSSTGKLLKELSYSTTHYFIPIPSSQIQDSEFRAKATGLGMGFVQKIEQETQVFVTESKRYAIVQIVKVFDSPFPDYIVKRDDDSQRAHTDRFDAIFARWGEAGPDSTSTEMDVYDNSGNQIINHIYGQRVMGFDLDETQVPPRVIIR